MKSNPHRLIALAALLALHEAKVHLPDRFCVQELHKEKKLTLQKALRHLTPIHGQTYLNNAREWVRKLEGMSWEDVRKRWTNVTDLYIAITSDAKFGERHLPASVKAQRDAPRRAQLIDEVNTLRRQKALAPLDPVK